MNNKISGKKLVLSVLMTVLTASAMAVADSAAAVPAGPAPGGASGASGAGAQLQFNFRAVSLDTVFDYLSKAGGFIIVRDKPLSETIDIISHQPLDGDEAVELLHTILNDRGYALLRNGRILRVISRDQARVHDLPVHSGNDPESVPRQAQMVTQIIAMRHTNAAKLIDTLRPLLPAGTVISANDDSNSLVVTDTQINIKRMMQIIQALDMAVFSILEIKVIPLAYADAKEMADVINKVYETPTQRNAAAQSAVNQRINTFARFRGREGGGMPEADSNIPEARQTASYVQAVPDLRANAVVVTAPGETIAQIVELVDKLDAPTEALSILRVFALRYAEASEIATVLAEIYADSSAARNQTQVNNEQRFRRPTPAPAAPPAQTGSESSRKLAEAKVVAVADTRTNSVIVSASPASMSDIESVITELDATPQNVPTVYIYQLKNADVAATRQLLESMFSGQDSSRAATGAAVNPAARTTTTGGGNRAATAIGR